MYQASIGPKNLFKSKKHRRDDYQRPKETGVMFTGKAEAYHASKIKRKERCFKKSAIARLWPEAPP